MSSLAWVDLNQRVIRPGLANPIRFLGAQHARTVPGGALNVAAEVTGGIVAARVGNCFQWDIAVAQNAERPLDLERLQVAHRALTSKLDEDFPEKRGRYPQFEGDVRNTDSAAEALLHDPLRFANQQLITRHHRLFERSLQQHVELRSQQLEHFIAAM